MGGRLARLDPFGQLSAGPLLQSWITVLAIFHGLGLLAALVLAGPLDVVSLAVFGAGFVLAGLSTHPAVKVAVLALWVGWWTYRFARVAGFHLGVGLLMLTSLWVIARVAFAWRRDDGASLRIGWRTPSLGPLDWPELAGLSERERQLVLWRARAHLPRPPAFPPRVLVGMGILSVIAMLELALFPPRAGNGSASLRPPSHSWPSSPCSCTATHARRTTSRSAVRCASTCCRSSSSSRGSGMRLAAPRDPEAAGRDAREQRELLDPGNRAGDPRDPAGHGSIDLGALFQIPEEGGE
jgi:hypothetical protein